MNNILFFGGIAAAVIAVIAAVVIFFVYRAGMSRLSRTLDAEYGERKKNPDENKRRA